MKADRIQTFSDGIFAILITILVLEFNVPVYEKGHLLESVLQQWPTLFAYLITFSDIGILWLFHHDIFGCIEYTTVKLNMLNLISIFLTTLLSYSMSLLSESLATLNEADMRFSFALYAILALSISASYFFIYGYLRKHKALMSVPEFGAHFNRAQRFPLISSLIYALAFILSFLNVCFSLMFLILGIVFHGFAYLRIATLRARLT
ncbi:MAG: TMEM175 family protein [Selenomonadaceae bacterium]